MDIVVLIAGVIVVALAVGYVIYPLFQGTGRREAAPRAGTSPRAGTVLAGWDSGLSDLLSEHDAVLQALRDLDFDYRLGKLSDQDYQALRAQYTARGVAILQQLDAATGLAGETGVLDEEIEAQVRRLRERPAPEVAVPAEPAAVSLEEAIEEEVRKLRARPAPAAAPSGKPRPVTRTTSVEAGPTAGRCPDCGQPYLSGDRFCARCGRALARTCPSCGAAADPEARFCAQCGAKLQGSSGVKP